MDEKVDDSWVVLRPATLSGSLAHVTAVLDTMRASRADAAVQVHGCTTLSRWSSFLFLTVPDAILAAGGLEVISSAARLHADVPEVQITACEVLCELVNSLDSNPLGSFSRVWLASIAQLWAHIPAIAMQRYPHHCALQTVVVHLLSSTVSVMIGEVLHGCTGGKPKHAVQAVLDEWCGSQHVVRLVTTAVHTHGWALGPRCVADAMKLLSKLCHCGRIGVCTRPVLQDTHLQTLRAVALDAQLRFDSESEDVVDPEYYDTSSIGDSVFECALATVIAACSGIDDDHLGGSTDAAVTLAAELLVELTATVDNDTHSVRRHWLQLCTACTLGSAAVAGAEDAQPVVPWALPTSRLLTAVLANKRAMCPEVNWDPCAQWRCSELACIVASFLPQDQPARIQDANLDELRDCACVRDTWTRATQIAVLRAFALLKMSWGKGLISWANSVERLLVANGGKAQSDAVLVYWALRSVSLAAICGPPSPRLLLPLPTRQC